MPFNVRLLVFKLYRDYNTQTTSRTSQCDCETLVPPVIQTPHRQSLNQNRGYIKQTTSSTFQHNTLGLQNYTETTIRRHRVPLNVNVRLSVLHLYRDSRLQYRHRIAYLNMSLWAICTETTASRPRRHISFNVRLWVLKLNRDYSKQTTLGTFQCGTLCPQTKQRRQ